MSECPQCGAVADTGTTMNLVRLPPEPGYAVLGPVSCPVCGWKEKPCSCSICSPTAPEDVMGK